jgi:predicted PurR-regulated permease PerM
MLAATATAIVFSGSTIVDEFREFQKTLPRAIASLQATSRLPIQAPLDRAVSNAEKLATGAWAAFGGSLELVSGLVVVFFLGIYQAADPDTYVRIALRFAPNQHRARIRHTLGRMFDNLRRWLFGRLVAMAFVAIACGVAFTLFGLPLALPLALLAGLLTFVEYVGAVASGVPPILLAFVQGPARALEILIFFTLLHVLEGYVLTPLLARTTVHLPPAGTLATQVLLAALLGPLGLTFATPLLVVAVTGVKEWSGQRGARARAFAEASAD